MVHDILPGEHAVLEGGVDGAQPFVSLEAGEAQVAGQLRLVVFVQTQVLGARLPETQHATVNIGYPGRSAHRPSRELMAPSAQWPVPTPVAAGPSYLARPLGSRFNESE